MGKRKYYEEDEEDYLERKIRSLQRKRSKIRRRRRHRSFSPSSSASSLNADHEQVECDVEDPDPLQEDLQNEGKVTILWILKTKNLTYFFGMQARRNAKYCVLLVLVHDNCRASSIVREAITDPVLYFSSIREIERCISGQHELS